jgi:hypothetical protein
MRYIMQHASAMRDKGGRYVFLIKAATSEVWWPEDADHIAFIRGRLGFDLPRWFIPKDEKQKPTGAFFAGAVAVFDKTWRGPAISYINRSDLESCGDAFLAQIRREAMRLLPQNQQQNIPETIPSDVWPAEVKLIAKQVSCLECIDPHHQRKVMYHINRMWLEKRPVTEIVATAHDLASAMEKVA